MIRRVIEKGPRVVAYRAWQLGRLSLLHVIRYWRGLQRQVHAFWSADRVERWMKIARGNELLIGPAKLEAFRSWSVSRMDWLRAVEACAEDIRKGQFCIFDQEHELEWDNLPWHADWRWQYTWEPAYYDTYDFYVPAKDVPYDVKFPWELSRFSFLFPLAQVAVMARELHWRERIASVVADWEQKNPTAYSVNWYPMESSMRGINLALIAQMLAADADTLTEHLAPLLRQLTLHGEFLFRNIEFTDVRGNHYAANLLALLLIGCTLQKVYQPASRWARYAAHRICHEIELQYYEDGVNIEKSVAYHRLVTELFLVGLVAMDQAGYPVSQVARERIHRACEYTRCYIRPDGLAPNWGDNDGARVLGFDPRPLRDHRSLLALAAAYFLDARFKSVAEQPSAAIPWLLGMEGVQRWNEMEVCENEPVARMFEAGGIVVSCASGHYLFADFGEVGHKGRGGHGHNDTFSFELCLCGKPLIVDSGSPVYTGDLEAYDRYRSTGYHNTVRIDGQEMARLLGVWRISNEAAPTNVWFQAGAECDVVQGEHRGYTRLADPVVHRRALTFYKHEGWLICKDSFQCASTHHVEQFLHFAPGIQVTLQGDALWAYLTEDTMASVRWTTGVRARVETAQVSENYGQLADSWMLVLEHEIAGDTELSFEITLKKSR